MLYYISLLLLLIHYSLGQYSVLKASEDDDEVPPPVPVYNPTGVQEYSELRREGEVSITINKIPNIQ